MFDLFGATVDTPMPSLELEHVDVPRSEQLAWERELLGVYVSGHPFGAASQSLGMRVSAVLAEISEEMNGRDVTLAGMVSMTRPLLTKDGRQFCAVTLEDLSGTLEVTVWRTSLRRRRSSSRSGRPPLRSEGPVPGDRLNLGVERVQPYQADATADEWDSMAGEAPGTNETGVPEPVLTGARSNGGGSVNGNGEWHGNGSRRNGYSNGNGNGSGGYRNGNGNGDQQSTTSRPKVLRLTIRETEAVDDDRQRLQSIMEALRVPRQRFLVRLTVLTSGGSTADMALAPVNAIEPLRQVVVGILGEYGNADIEMV